MFTRFRYPLAFRLHDVPGFLCIPHLSLQRFFFQAQPFPGIHLSRFIGQGSFGLGSPVSGTMTALRLLIALPVRFAELFSRYFRLAPLSCRLSLFSLGAGKSPVYLYPALSAGGFLPQEAMTPHTFPYDLLYICPALRPRLR